MIYLSHFEFPDILKEELFINDIKRTCYDTFYPFMVVSKHGLRMLDFAPVTILYGGNGSGKTTAGWATWITAWRSAWTHNS